MAEQGSKTSEFWTMVITLCVGPLSALAAAAAGNPTLATIIGAITFVAPIAYIVVRGWLKAEQAKQIDLISPEMEAKIQQIVDISEQLTSALNTKKAEQPKE